jgi:hypothetical protein
MSQKTFIPVSFSLALLSMFLPFIRYEVFGWDLFSMTGFELVFSIESVINVQIFALAAVVGIISSFTGNQSTPLLTTICGSVGLLALGTFTFMGTGAFSGLYAEYGLYLAGFFMLAATLLSLMNLQTPAFSGAKSQGLTAPGAGHFGGLPPQRIPHHPRNINVDQQMRSPTDTQGYPSVQSPINQTTVPMGYLPTAAAPRNIVPQHYQNVTTGLLAGYPKMIGISGQYAGQKIDLSSGPVTIGRDPSIANLVYRQTNKDVSRRHCTVSYDHSRQSFTIVDTSTNGTFLLPFERLTQGRQVQINSGTRFFISDPSEQFEVRVD